MCCQGGGPYQSQAAGQVCRSACWQWKSSSSLKCCVCLWKEEKDWDGHGGGGGGGKDNCKVLSSWFEWKVREQVLSLWKLEWLVVSFVGFFFFQKEELLVVYTSDVVAVDGFSLLHCLRACSHAGIGKLLSAAACTHVYATLYLPMCVCCSNHLDASHNVCHFPLPSLVCCNISQFLGDPWSFTLSGLTDYDIHCHSSWKRILRSDNIHHGLLFWSFGCSRWIGHAVTVL